jgi:Glycoside Hydrolase Family 113/Secretion system C-terminal sorting domain
MGKRIRLTMIIFMITLTSLFALDTPNFIRAVHMGGNWGRNTFSVLDPPQEYFNFLSSINANWVGISVALHIENSMDSTVERVYSGVDIPTFNEQDLINVIRTFKENHFNVYLTLAFEAEEAEHAAHPVSRWQLGDPKMHIEDPNIMLDYWPWAPEHPAHDSFVKKFFKTYTDQAVYYANICEQEGVAMYSLGTETNRLFRTRTGGYWPNNYLTYLNAMVDSIRQAYHGILTYDMEYGALTDAGFFMLDSLWKDMDLDAIGISAYFPLTATMPDTVMSTAQLTHAWHRIFKEHLAPLQNQNPGKPIYFLEFGYVDAIGSPREPANREFEYKLFEDANQNGLDDGEETQANIHEAFFHVNTNYNDLVKGAFLWGNQMASDIDWENSFGQLRDFAVRGKLAKDIVRDHYANYCATPEVPVLIYPENGSYGITNVCTLRWQASEHATSYRIQLAKNDRFTIALKDKTIADTSFIALGLDQDTLYYWRVKALNQAVESEWSDMFVFSTGMTNSISSQINEFNLQQNHPNPFNPKTVITYRLTASNDVNLSVYDIKGKMIEILVNEYKPAGYHSIRWDASAYPSGIYFYRLRVGDPKTGSGVAFIQTKKMLLIK